MATSPTILRLAIPSPLHRTFDYLMPPEVEPHQLQAGMRLRVPFGRSQTIGILLAVTDSTDVPPAKLKAAIEVLDSKRLISAKLLKLLQWAAHYHHYPVGEVLAAALPTLLRQGESAVPRNKSLWTLTSKGRLFQASELERRAPRQAEMLERLQRCATGLTAEQMTDAPTNWSNSIAALVKKELVNISAVPSLETGSGDEGAPPQLNDAQDHAVTAIRKKLGAFAPFLLDGVTGSGKTEVYLRVIEQVLADGGQALILVPEIALTPQLVERFKKRFSVPMAVLHSGISDRDRLNAWCYARDGEASIIIGTRSAVFTPLKNAGIIIIDEEHDPSFKQQRGFRYSARDLAIVRAQQLEVPVVLGSATPSFESLHNVELARYTRLRLTKRAGSAKPPAIELLDVRNQAMEDQISHPLVLRMRKHLEAGNQVLLFLNRRGFAPTLICHECGWIAECRRCDAHMTLHQGHRQLRCHHCGGQQPVPHQCTQCGSADLRGLGSGTERIEQTLAEHFPDINIARIDRDNTRRRGSMETILEGVHNGETRILIGTQMLAKGHHFPGVTLVGILDGDQGLFGIDFRASERMAQLIIQVAGRAGREEKVGQVVIQTHHPEHPQLQSLCGHGYHAFAKDAMEERKLALLPPYTYMALLRAEAGERALPHEFLEQAQQLAAQINIPQVELFGPLPSPMERRAGKYRAQLLLQSTERPHLHQLLSRWVTQLHTLPLSRKVRWSLDVDPVDLI